MTPTFTVSPKALVDTISGGSAMWDVVQFHRFDIFGNEIGTAGTVSSPLTVTLHTSLVGFGDNATGYADGVGTARRSHVGFTPNELFRSAWIPSSTTTPILTMTSPAPVVGQGTAIVQFVCILRSTAGAPAAVEGSARAAALHESPMTTFREVFDESE